MIDQTQYRKLNGLTASQLDRAAWIAGVRQMRRGLSSSQARRITREIAREQRQAALGRFARQCGQRVADRRQGVLGI